MLTLQPQHCHLGTSAYIHIRRESSSRDKQSLQCMPWLVAMTTMLADLAALEDPTIAVCYSEPNAQHSILLYVYDSTYIRTYVSVTYIHMYVRTYVCILVGILLGRNVTCSAYVVSEEGILYYRSVAFGRGAGWPIGMMF